MIDLDPLVLIGHELLETLRSYVVDHTIHAEIVLMVASIAVARKIITMNLSDQSGSVLAGIAAILIALAVACHLFKTHKKKPADGIIDRIADNGEPQKAVENEPHP